MERRKFTREFKLKAVRLIRERGVAYTQAARDLSDAIMAKRVPSAHAERQGLRCVEYAALRSWPVRTQP
jgi:transposase